MSTIVEPEQQTGTAIETRPIGQLARREYVREQIELIKATVAEGASDAELDLFLELAARYQLDPFAGHIWCARMRGENAQSGKMVVLVGRDGMLVLARRHKDFKALRGNVVHEHDEFAVEEKDDDTVVRHNIGHPNERGDIVGAWAKVIREGEHPTFFYAPLSEYLPTHDKVSKTPWGHQRSAMILKCAQSTALRFAFSITGLVGAEEITAQLADPRKAEMDAVAGDIEWGEDEEVKARLSALFAAANETVTDSFRPRKIQAMLKGKDDADRQQVIEDLEKFIEKNGGTVPDRVVKCERTDLDPHTPHHWKRRPDGSYGDYDDEGEMLWCPGDPEPAEEAEWAPIAESEVDPTADDVPFGEDAEDVEQKPLPEA